MVKPSTPNREESPNLSWSLLEKSKRSRSLSTPNRTRKGDQDAIPIKEAAECFEEERRILLKDISNLQKQLSESKEECNRQLRAGGVREEKLKQENTRLATLLDKASSSGKHDRERCAQAEATLQSTLEEITELKSILHEQQESLRQVGRRGREQVDGEFRRVQDLLESSETNRKTLEATLDQVRLALQEGRREWCKERAVLTAAVEEANSRARASEEQAKRAKSEGQRLEKSLLNSKSQENQLRDQIAEMEGQSLASLVNAATAPDGNDTTLLNGDTKPSQNEELLEYCKALEEERNDMENLLRQAGTQMQEVMEKLTQEKEAREEAEEKIELMITARSAMEATVEDMSRALQEVKENQSANIQAVDKISNLHKVCKDLASRHQDTEEALFGESRGPVAIEQRLEALYDEISAMKRQQASADGEIEFLGNELAKQELENEALRAVKEASEWRTEVEQLLARILSLPLPLKVDVLKAALNGLASKAEKNIRSDADIQEFMQHFEQLKEELNNIRQNSIKLTADIESQLQDLVASLGEEADHLSATETIELLRDKIAELSEKASQPNAPSPTEISDLRRTLRAKETEIQDLKEKVADVERCVVALDQNSTAQLQDLVASLGEDADHLNAPQAIELLKAKIEELRENEITPTDSHLSEIAELQTVLRKKEEDIQHLQLEVSKAKRRALTSPAVSFKNMESLQESDLKSFQQKLQEQIQNVERMNLEYEQCDIARSKAERELQLFKQKYDEQVDSAAVVVKENHSLRAAQEKFEELIKDLSELNEELKKQLESEKAEKNQLQGILSQVGSSSDLAEKENVGLKRRLENLEQKLQVQRKKNEEMSKHCDTLEQEIEDAQAQNKEIQDQLEDATRQLEVRNLTENFNSEKLRSSEDLFQKEALKNQKIAEEQVSLAAELKSKEEALQAQNEKYAGLQEQNKRLERALSELQDLNAEQVHVLGQVEKSRNELLLKAKDLEEKEKLREKAKEDEETILKLLLEQQKDKLKDFENQVSALKGEKAECLRDAQLLQNDITRLERANQSLENQMEKKQSGNTSLCKEVERLKADLKNQKKQHADLAQMLEEKQMQINKLLDSNSALSALQGENQALRQQVQKQQSQSNELFSLLEQAEKKEQSLKLRIEEGKVEQSDMQKIKEKLTEATELLRDHQDQIFEYQDKLERYQQADALLQMELQKCTKALNDTYQQKVNLEARNEALQDQVDKIPRDVTVALAENRALMNDLEKIQQTVQRLRSDHEEDLRRHEIDFRNYIKAFDIEKGQLLQRIQEQAITIHQLTVHCESLNQTSRANEEMVSSNNQASSPLPGSRKFPYDWSSDKTGACKPNQSKNQFRNDENSSLLPQDLSLSVNSSLEKRNKLLNLGNLNLEISGVLEPSKSNSRSTPGASALDRSRALISENAALLERLASKKY